MEKSTVLAAAVLVALVLAGSSARAQNAKPIAPAQETSTAKTPRVWTNDNIASVRTASDDYQIQQAREKEAQEAAAKKAAAQAARAVGPKPKSIKQADSMIAQKKRHLANQQAYLQRLQKDMNNPGNSSVEQMRLNWRLKSHTASEKRTQADLAKLEAEKTSLAKKEAAEKAAASNASSNGDSTSTGP